MPREGYSLQQCNFTTVSRYRGGTTTEMWQRSSVCEAGGFAVCKHAESVVFEAGGSAGCEAGHCEVCGAVQSTVCGVSVS